MFAILHKPSGKICEVENGVCYEVFSSVELAQESINEVVAGNPDNYEVVVLPVGLIPFKDTFND